MSFCGVTVTANKLANLPICKGTRSCGAASGLNARGFDGSKNGKKTTRRKNKTAMPIGECPKCRPGSGNLAGHRGRHLGQKVGPYKVKSTLGRSPSPAPPAPAPKKLSGLACAAPSGGRETAVPGLLVLGVLPNLFLLSHLSTLEPLEGREGIVTAAQIYVGVNGFRCVFPNRYSGNIVLHDSPLSSILLTRTLATFSEMAWLTMLAVVALDANDGEAWIANGARAMPLICTAAQCLVWSSLLLQTDSFMYWEEALWAAMFVINTAIAAAYATAGQESTLNSLSLVFGALYLPWQCGLHLPSIASRQDPPLMGALSWERVKKGAAKAAFEMNPSTDSDDWGGGELQQKCQLVLEFLLKSQKEWRIAPDLVLKNGHVLQFEV